MFHFLKTFAFILTLSTPVLAQWGAVVAQPDTNRFINSTQTYGLVMPHQDIIIGKLDTTITSVGTGGGNGSKVIVGSLLNWDDNCVGGKIINGEWDCSGSYEAWREKEKSTSWYQAARGDTSAQFPTNYAVTITTGQDSVVIWNRDTAELWMAFPEGDAGLAWDAAQTGNGIAFKDGILYIAQSNGFSIADFLQDEGYRYNSTSFYRYKGTLQDRGALSGFLAMHSSVTIGNNTVNAVAVVRDPFGLTDVNGAPKHWVVVSQNGTTGQEVYNPHTNAFYFDGTGVIVGGASAIDKRGTYAWVARNTGDYFYVNDSIFDVTADSYSFDNTMQTPTQDGSWRDVAWTTGAVNSDVALISGKSIMGENSYILLGGSDEGLYAFHPLGGNGNIIGTTGDGARQRFSSTVNAPVEFGNAIWNMALESATDSSPYADDATEVGGAASFVTAVFGSGFSSKVGSYLESTAIEDVGTNSVCMSAWFKSAGTTNPAGSERILALDDNAAGSEYILLYVNAGTINFLRDDGVSPDQVAPSLDFYDNKWHHIVGRSDITAGIFDLWVDGVLVGSDGTINATTAVTTSSATVGAHYDGTARWRGIIDEAVIGCVGSSGMIGEKAIAKLHAEGRKKLNMGTPVFTSTPDDALLSNAVIAIDALDNGIWAVAFSDANTVQVFDGRIPIQQIAAPAGTVADIALIQNAGSDSVGVAIVTTTNLKIVQPSVSLEKAYLSQLYHNKPILITEQVVVDSAGVGGIFWTAQDGADAAANANIWDVLALNGTYGGFSLLTGTHDGMHFHCAGARSATGGNDGGVEFQGGASSNALVMSHNGRVSNCGFYTTPGGGSGGYHAVNLSTGSYGSFDHNVIRDSDDYGINVAMGHANVGHNMFLDTDGNVIQVTGTGDGSIIIGNRNQASSGTYFVGVNSGGNYVSVTGNVGDLGIDNSQTGAVNVGNSEF